MRVFKCVVIMAACGSASSAALADVVSGPLAQVPESTFYMWGEPAPLRAFWSERNAATGWIYGSGFPTVNVAVYVAGTVDPTTVADASVFAYTADAVVFNEGDTIFFRGSNGYYGAWVVSDIGSGGTVIDGTWYYQNDGTAGFATEPPPPPPGPIGCNEWVPAPGGGMDANVNAMTVFDEDLIVAGDFTSVSGLAASRIARWDGHEWSTLGTGLNQAGRALAVYDGDLIVGGNFSTAGGVAASRIAKWDGTTWLALGPGLNGVVTSLAVYNGELIARGGFTFAGALPVSRVAAWNGTSWRALGTGVDTTNSGSSLTVYNGELITGGLFASAGGMPAMNIARWNGTAWAGLGSGITQGSFEAAVFALTVYGDELIAAGAFSEAGGVSASNIARWDGAEWSPLGAGSNFSINALTTYNGDLIAGGTFTTMGGLPINRVARWNGAQWRALGQGVGDALGQAVHAMSPHYSYLAVGGDFGTAAGATSPRYARWSDAACPADFTCDAAVNSQDFFDYIAAFFTNDPSADFNNDTIVNSQDFFDFLVAFFVGCG